MTKLSVRVISAFVLAFGIVAGWSSQGAARKVPGFKIANPPGFGQKSFARIPANNPNRTGTPLYEECELDRTDYCDSFPLEYAPGKANGHTLHLVLTWKPVPPAPGQGNRLDYILWNDKVRSECEVEPDPSNPDAVLAARFCGAEAQSIGGNYPKTMDLYDLPGGTYTVHVINHLNQNEGYTLRGDIEFLDITRAPRRSTPAPPKAGVTTPRPTPKRTPEPTLEPLPTPSPERFPTPGPDGPLSDVEVPLVAAGKQVGEIGEEGNLAGRVLLILALVAVIGGGGATLFVKIRRDRV